jgi:hypothetical protein
MSWAITPTRSSICDFRTSRRGQIAATDVEADAGNRDVILIADDAADRMRVTEMPVGAQHATRHAADLHAAIHLRECALVVPAENPRLGHLVRT